MLERRVGADQSGGSKLRETDVGRTEGTRDQGKGREETRVLRRGKEEWKEVCERRGIRKERSRENSEEEETTEKKSKPSAPRAQRRWKMVKTDSSNQNLNRRERVRTRNRAGIGECSWFKVRCSVNVHHVPASHNVRTGDTGALKSNVCALSVDGAAVGITLTLCFATDQAGCRVAEGAQDGADGQAQVLVTRVERHRGKAEIRQLGRFLRTDLHVRDLRGE